MGKNKNKNHATDVVAVVQHAVDAALPTAAAIHNGDVLGAVEAIIHAGSDIAADVETAAPEDHKAATAHWIMSLLESGIDLVRHFEDESAAAQVHDKLNGHLAGHPLQHKGRSLEVHVPTGTDHLHWAPVVKSLVEAAGHKIEHAGPE